MARDDCRCFMSGYPDTDWFFREPPAFAQGDEDEGEDEEFEGRAGEEEIADEFEEEPVEEDSRPKVPKDPNGKYGH